MADLYDPTRYQFTPLRAQSTVGSPVNQPTDINSLLSQYKAGTLGAYTTSTGAQGGWLQQFKAPSMTQLSTPTDSRGYMGPGGTNWDDPNLLKTLGLTRTQGATTPWGTPGAVTYRNAQGQVTTPQQAFNAYNQLWNVNYNPQALGSTTGNAGALAQGTNLGAVNQFGKVVGQGGMMVNPELAKIAAERSGLGTNVRMVTNTANLKDPSAVKYDPLFGYLTAADNIKERSFWDEWGMPISMAAIAGTAGLAGAAGLGGSAAAGGTAAETAFPGYVAGQYGASGAALGSGAGATGIGAAGAAITDPLLMGATAYGYPSGAIAGGAGGPAGLGSPGAGGYGVGNFGPGTGFAAPGAGGTLGGAGPVGAAGTPGLGGAAGAATQGGGFLSSVGQFIKENPGMIKAGVGGLTGLIGAIQANQQAKELQGAAASAQERADPFGPYRGQFAEQLMALTQDPSRIQQNPAYKARLEAGLEAINRQAAAKGYLGSGNRFLGLQEYGQKSASEEYDKEVNRLAQLAGAQFAPGTGAALGFQGLQASQGAESQRNAAIGQGIGSIVDWALGGQQQSSNQEDLYRKALEQILRQQGGGY